MEKINQTKSWSSEQVMATDVRTLTRWADHKNRWPTSIRETESTNNNLTKQKVPAPDGSTDEF